jgi:hypothetical protein
LDAEHEQQVAIDEELEDNQGALSLPISFVHG